MRELASAWRRHRARMLRAPRDGRQHAARMGYFELLVAAAPVVLDAERRDDEILPMLLVASGGIS